MSLALATVSCVLLALVAGLLMLLGQLLRGMRKELREAPLLAEKLAQQLLAVRAGLEQARVTIHKLGPDLGANLETAQATLDDLKFLLGRGEQLASRLEQAQGKSGLNLNGAAATSAEVHVVQETVATVRAGDPLETLLADLEQAGSVQTGPNPALGRRPSQAEMELRAKERGN